MDHSSWNESMTVVAGSCRYLVRGRTGGGAVYYSIAQLQRIDAYGTGTQSRKIASAYLFNTTLQEGRQKDAEERTYQLNTKLRPTITRGVLLSGRERDGRCGGPSGGKRAQAQQVPQEAGAKAGGLFYCSFWFFLFRIFSFLAPLPLQNCTDRLLRNNR